MVECGMWKGERCGWGNRKYKYPARDLSVSLSLQLLFFSFPLILGKVKFVSVSASEIEVKR
jgi:hypothetical protein